MAKRMCFVLLATLLVALTAHAVDKTVLLEGFTNTG